MRDRAPVLTVDLEAIAANTRRFRDLTGGAIMAVLKADAFGHGDVAATVLANGASWIGVTTIEEALALRYSGITAPLLSWLNPPGADFRTAVDHNVDLAVPSLVHLRAIAEAAHAAQRTARIHLHVDAGIHRDGAPLGEWDELCAMAHRAERAGAVEVVGIMGHLSTADVPHAEVNAEERHRFLGAVATAQAAGLTPADVHLAASAATLHQPQTWFTLSRIGVGLYGIDPAHQAELRPALTLTAPVVTVRRIEAGEGVGYGHTYRPGRATSLALLPVGYADGIPRRASSRAWVQIGGVRHPVVGLISMDQTIVDVGDHPVRPGDIAVLFGPGDGGEPTVQEWAEWSDTIAHDIMTGIGSRATRVVRRIVASLADVTGPIPLVGRPSFDDRNP